jgi:hypothetical protein
MASLERDNLGVYFYLCAPEIWPDKRETTLLKCDDV